MLTIQNVTKLYKADVLDWRIGKIMTTKTQYTFFLMKGPAERMAVVLERNPEWFDVSENKEHGYEMWYNNNNMTTVKYSIAKQSIETPTKMLKMIERLIQQS